MLLCALLVDIGCQDQTAVVVVYTVCMNSYLKALFEGSIVADLIFSSLCKYVY